jgi:hypothetical protein
MRKPMTEVVEGPLMYRGARVPTRATLRRYGWTEERWKARWDEQGGVCPVCAVAPRTGRTVLDHQHVKGWKAMPPEQRAEYVRGIVCVTCNHFVLTRYGTVLKFLGAAMYLANYQYPERGRPFHVEVFNVRNERVNT